MPLRPRLTLQEHELIWRQQLHALNLQTRRRSRHVLSLRRNRAKLMRCVSRSRERLRSVLHKYFGRIPNTS